jgi:hypothetical protein
MAGGTGAFQVGNQLPGFLVDILASTGALAVAGTGVAYSNSFVLRRGVTFGWEVKLTSSGVCTVTIELEQANQPPTTEGTQDDAFVIPVNKLTTAGMFPTGIIVTAATHYITAYSPDATVLGRLKITGTGSNDASTKLVLARMYEIKNV